MAVSAAAREWRILYSAQKHSKGGDDDAIGTATSASSGAGGHRHRHGRRRRHAAERGDRPACHGGGPDLRSRSALAETLAQRRAAWHGDRGIGRCPGQRLDGPPQQPDAAQQRMEQRLNPPIAACCRGAPPVLAFNQDGDTIRACGRTRRRLRMAGIDARRLCRPQGQCLARRQWRKGCSNPQVQPGRQVRAAVRPSRQECWQQRYRELRACGADLRRSEDQ